MANHFSHCLHAGRILVALLALQAGFARAETLETTPRVVADSQHVNEACSERADALGLHGEARWTYRARCKSQNSAEYCSERADALGLHGEARWVFRAGCKA